MRRRALLISDYGWPTGGTEEFVRALAEALCERFDTELLVWASSQAPVPESVEVTGIDHGDVLRIWSSVAQADVVLVVTSFNMRALAQLASGAIRHTGTPAITILQTSAHSTPAAAAAPQQAAALRELAGLSRVVVGASGAVEAGLREVLPSSAEAPVVVIENGSRLVDHTPRRRGKRQVTFIGRPTDSKGYPAFARLVRSLSGSGIQFAANTVSIPADVELDGVSYTRCLTDSELRALFARTDLLVAPYWRADGLPLAVLEALNCGVPVMGFDSPAVGPLLRAHEQHVIRCDSQQLADDVLAWRVGALDIKAPRPGCVPSLANQAAKYVQLVDWILAESAPRMSARQVINGG